MIQDREGTEEIDPASSVEELRAANRSRRPGPLLGLLDPDRRLSLVYRWLIRPDPCPDSSSDQGDQ